MEISDPSGGRKDIKQAYRIAYLIAGFLKNNLTQQEKQELDRWILASEDNMILFEKMTDEKNLAEASDWFRQMKVEEGLRGTKKKIAANKSKKIWSYAAAACLALLVGSTIYIYMIGKRKTQPIAMEKHDIEPGSNRATLMLDNGKTIFLDSVEKDSAVNDQVKILKEGEVVYAAQPTSNQMVFNTLLVPRQGHYKLTLPDGTIVWLNAESSIRFPVAFDGNERKVFITGETFFQVAKDKTKPFRVVTNNNITVEALGTQFNVNAYNNEPFVAATLAEGSVLVTGGQTENILKPGQQAQIKPGSFQISTADIDEVTAWKNNQFKFKNTAVDNIMRQIERWYDANVVYEDSISLHLNATIGRDVPVSKLLHIFEETNEIHFKIEGKKITVMK
jgi:ferric-dicitrate binding protein FerR (iron transport regulator)